MYLKVNNKKIRIQEAKTFKERFTSLKFQLKLLDYGIYFPHKHFLNTTFFCQRVDVCFTDKENKILYLHSNIKSERRIIHFKAKNFYILPLGTCEQLKVGDTLKLTEK